MDKVKLPNHIEEYFDSSSSKAEFIELFEADEDDIDLKTDLSHPEIVVVNAIIFNHTFLEKKNIPSPYSWIAKYLRLKVSCDRKSRAEFVDINKKERFENNLDKFNSIANLQKVKQ